MRKKLVVFFMAMMAAVSLSACGRTPEKAVSSSEATLVTEKDIVVVQPESEEEEADELDTAEEEEINVPEHFVLIQGGSFQMGSPEEEAWRSDDETQHTVTVSDFYMSQYELTQEEYEAVTGENPSNFAGENLPVENVSWLSAVAYCNARSQQEGLTPVYTIEGQNISWDRSADGYRLPTEAEWEYACRAGTETPFYIAESPSADEANYYGHYPYQIEENYFSQGNLTVQPGIYRQTTTAVGSFAPNPLGLYDMYGNVGEWVWDYYGSYPSEEQADPTGPDSGVFRVYRGGGWNDFAKNMRSAYRAALDQEKSSFNIGIRLVRNAAAGIGNVTGSITSEGENTEQSGERNILIAYFSWGGNTEGIAKEIQSQTEAELFEIMPETPYSNDYNTVLEEAQRDQNEQVRPPLAAHIENMDQYDIILLGYPNWWASIPMPVASFLEEYDFSGKTIIPFCSHGGGRFGQSLTDIAKLAPGASMGEGLSVHYSGGGSLSGDVADWLIENGIGKE